MKMLNNVSVVYYPSYSTPNINIPHCDSLILTNLESQNLNFLKIFQEGQISEAENSKLKLEQAQRERRGQMEEMGKIHDAKWFTKKNNSWTFQESYWNLRNDPTGFENANLLDLW